MSTALPLSKSPDPARPASDGGSGGSAGYGQGGYVGLDADLVPEGVEVACCRLCNVVVERFGESCPAHAEPDGDDRYQAAVDRDLDESEGA